MGVDAVVDDLNSESVGAVGQQPGRVLQDGSIGSGPEGLPIDDEGGGGYFLRGHGAERDVGESRDNRPVGRGRDGDAGEGRGGIENAVETYHHARRWSVGVRSLRSGTRDRCECGKKWECLKIRICLHEVGSVGQTLPA